MSGASGGLIYGQKQKEIADSNPLPNTVSADAGICGQEKRTEAESLQGKTKSVFPFLFFPNHGVEFVVDFGDGF